MAAIEFYVMLLFGNMRLLLKQQEIRVVEVIEDVETSSVKPEEALAGIMGWISHGEQQYPVFSLSDALDILDYLPEKRLLCVLLEVGVDAIFGITCEEVVSLDEVHHLPIFPMPESMRLASSPLSHLAIYQGKHVACITNSEALLDYLTAYAEAHMLEIEEHEESFEQIEADIEPVIVTEMDDEEQQIEEQIFNQESVSLS